MSNIVYFRRDFHRVCRNSVEIWNIRPGRIFGNLGNLGIFFPRFLIRVFDLALHLKSKTWNLVKFSFTSNFYRFDCIKHGKG